MHLPVAAITSSLIFLSLCTFTLAIPTLHSGSTGSSRNNIDPHNATNPYDALLPRQQPFLVTREPLAGLFQTSDGIPTLVGPDFRLFPSFRYALFIYSYQPIPIPRLSFWLHDEAGDEYIEGPAVIPSVAPAPSQSSSVREKVTAIVAIKRPVAMRSAAEVILVGKGSVVSQYPVPFHLGATSLPVLSLGLKGYFRIEVLADPREGYLEIWEVGADTKIG